MAFKAAGLSGVKVDGVERLLAQIQAAATRIQRDNRVKLVVGYTAPYAIYQHENLEYRHKRGQIAKFLEKPLRRLSGTFKKMISGASRRRPLKTIFHAIGVMLKEASQQVVPVGDRRYVDKDGFQHPGRLKRSAFFRVEDR